MENFGKRSWVKLWTNEWLEGSTRYEMSDAQRAFFVDLVAMAGRSRFPGIICADYNGKDPIGYPLTKFQSLMSGPFDVEATLALFERTGKITVTVNSDRPQKLYAIVLLNWSKYQSEYQRVKKYKKYQNPRYERSTHGSTTEVTQQKERKSKIQIQIEKTEEAAAEPDGSGTASASRISSAFQSIGVGPFGSKPFQEAWTRAFETITDNKPSSFVTAMEDAIQDCNARGVKVPGKFFELKRQVEKMEVQVCFRRTPL